jgi:ribosome maturation factor RimP
MEPGKDIWKIAEEELVNSSQFIVDVVVSARKGPKKIIVIIDGDDGVSIEDCALLSRAISKKLDETSILGDDNFVLEVSTPGVDHPLKLNRQYKKNVGRRLKVKTTEKVMEGKLETVTDDGITLLEETGSGKKKETKHIEIPYSQIEKAFVLVSFK